jgi:hypothetical protein
VVTGVSNTYDYFFDLLLFLIEYEKSFAVCRFGFTILKRFMPEDKLADVKGATLTVDGTGVVFDVPAADAEDYIQGILCFHFYVKKNWHKNVNVHPFCVCGPTAPL